MQIEYSFKHLFMTILWVIVLTVLFIYEVEGDQTLLNCAQISSATNSNQGVPKTKEEQVLQLESQYFNQLSKFAPCSIDEGSSGANDNSKTSVLNDSSSNSVDTNNQYSTDKVNELERISQQEAEANAEGVKSISSNLKANDYSSLSIDSRGFQNDSSSNSVDTNNQYSTDKVNELERISQQEAEANAEGVKSISSNLKANDYSSLSIDSGGFQIIERLDSDFSEDTSKISEIIPNGSTHSNLKNVDNIKILKEQLRERAEKEPDPQVKKSLMKRYEEL